MPNNLALFPFNNLSNTAISDDGWRVETGAVVDGLAGNDIITGDGGSGTGIHNDGTINTGKGNDTITGSGNYGISNRGTINTGPGNDNIIVRSSIFFNHSTGIINTGSGDDTITCTSEYGIYNYGTINTGSGDNTVTGIGTFYGRGSTFGIINGGNGNIKTGSGKDKIIGECGSYYGMGIVNGRDSRINTRGGDDAIIGIGKGTDTLLGDGYGISNFGTINTGGGKDIVDALQGGFGGSGITSLGSGRDTLKGFGKGTFYGGTGIDKILFGQGTYTVTGSTIISDDVTMNVNEFEKIGGANGGLFNYRNGTLTVNSDGVATFAA